MTVSNDDIGVLEMIALFKKFNLLTTNGEGVDENFDDPFYHFMIEYLIYDDTAILKHLPVSVFLFLNLQQDYSLYIIFCC